MMLQTFSFQDSSLESVRVRVVSIALHELLPDVNYMYFTIYSTEIIMLV